MIPFFNPYATVPVVLGTDVIIDYAQPLNTVVYVDPVAQPGTYPSGTPVVSDQAVQDLDAARAAFLVGDYALALQNVNAAIVLMPGDASLHEFRALILFALGQYNDAAAVLSSMLAVRPGWDWTTMIGLYPSVDVYTAQLRALEVYVSQTPNLAAPRFLLAYHYLTEGFTDAAREQLQYVVQLAPGDTVAAQLLQKLTPVASTAGASEVTPAAETVATPAPSTPAGTSPPAATAATALPEQPATPPAEQTAQQPATVAIDPARLLGTWKATRPDGSTYTLSLSDGSQFTWVYSRATKSTTVTGTYAVEQDTLTLSDPKRGAMAGQVTMGDENSFTFHFVGAPPGQGELSFRR